MKRALCIMIFISFLIFAMSLNGISDYGEGVIDKVRLSDSDVPEGYMYGKIPDFARKVLKGNPWMMDSSAVRRLTKRIYPDGNYSKVLKIHVTILADRKTPYGDDIVCYIILYRDSSSARDEIKKITRFVEFNRDRAILVNKMNLVIFFHVDDIKDFHYIKKIGVKLEDKLSKL